MPRLGTGIALRLPPAPDRKLGLTLGEDIRPTVEGALIRGAVKRGALAEATELRPAELTGVDGRE